MWVWALSLSNVAMRLLTLYPSVYEFLAKNKVTFILCMYAHTHACTHTLHQLYCCVTSFFSQKDKVVLKGIKAT
jgi:hypothetical protein